MVNAGSVYAFEELGEREEKAPSNALRFTRAALMGQHGCRHKLRY